MIRVIKLRLKLSDFIDTDLEKMIMERIKAIENDLQIRIILYFWLGDENIDLKSFYERWKENLSIKTIIKNTVANRISKLSNEASSSSFRLSTCLNIPYAYRGINVQ